MVGGGCGGVCKVIFMSNPTVVLRLGWGFDNFETYREGVTQVDVASIIGMVSYVVLDDFNINFLGI